ncbi:hypothetical protein BJI67_02655 [Acidihalobacter aeolianus]|uniref:ABC transporter domain-containing protein n=1 Tax=Acidihalobacter aeolianus TaxID=2792603 RepID=A0A1D8K589_9GAMM|nr:ABC transporter ATP-binding protein [Acidihalobacter aeolianus]AOV16112.1 hypothetical protein BJI67_02655 [Acidihalobacter aeolianus]
MNSDTSQNVTAVQPPRLELVGLTKRFPGVLANDRVDVSVRAGEIHALLGENGAGKSTLMKMIYGLLAPDEGSILWEGRETVIDGPVHARRLGMGMVQQHFSLLESLTVAENLALTLNRRGRWEPARVAARVAEAEGRYGLAVEPRRPVHSLSVGQRQRVEILRCLLQEEPLKLLILDEPTAVLTPQEVGGLFEVLRRLAAQGLSILFVSHKLDEVKALCERVTVLRGGRVVARRDMADVTVDELATLMVGDRPPALRARRAVAGAGEVRLALQGLDLAPDHPHGTALSRASLELRRGEILGLAGVSGNGQQELLAALVGERPVPADCVLIDGEPVGRMGVAERRRRGLRYVPEDRLGTGAVPSLSLIDNALLTRWPKATRFGWVSLAAAWHWAQAICERYQVRQAGVGMPASSLSGGNLQKFIVGRELDETPEIFVVVQPTWGVDVAAARRIQDALLALREQGTALLVISDDLDELLALADRVAVISGGRVSSARPVAEVGRAQLGQLMGGRGLEAEVPDAAA